MQHNEMPIRTAARPIKEIAAEIGLTEDDLEYYGKFKAKVSLEVYQRLKDRDNGKLIYVTAITPTPAGEGKTCTAIGLTQAMGKLGKKVVLCLREPSLGPTFGLKGGAAGGGMAKVLPMEDINLHFTGDIHAVSAAHNLLAAMIDNSITFGNPLNINPKRVLWRRVIDITDRSLRTIKIGAGHDLRETGFDIAAASEIMAILCLAEDLEDLKKRLNRIVVGFTYDDLPVRAAEIGAVGAMTVLLKDAVKPNLVQTAEGQPAFVHGGPFANIAHGNNSIIATRTALKLGDYVITEGGFASDLGAEKFFDIVTHVAGIRPDMAVLVASIRALKFHGGLAENQLAEENLAALEKGLVNLDKHFYNMNQVYGLPTIVAINRFPTDTEAEIAFLRQYCEEKKMPVALSEVVGKGGEGGLELAEKVLHMLESCRSNFQPLYDLGLPVTEKIQLVARKIYGADGVDFSEEAKTYINRLTELQYGNLPVCIAKTQKSLSDDATKLGAPSGWRLKVREVRLSAGAGFLVAIAGNILTMPGFPKTPAAEKIDIMPDGTIKGLF